VNTIGTLYYRVESGQESAVKTMIQVKK
jgi:hypothetical protein